MPGFYAQAGERITLRHRESILVERSSRGRGNRHLTRTAHHTEIEFVASLHLIRDTQSNTLIADYLGKIRRGAANGAAKRYFTAAT
jgi:hypothetical protein